MKKTAQNIGHSQHGVESNATFTGITDLGMMSCGGLCFHVHNIFYGKTTLTIVLLILFPVTFIFRNTDYI